MMNSAPSGKFITRFRTADRRSRHSPEPRLVERALLPDICWVDDPEPVAEEELESL